MQTFFEMQPSWTSFFNMKVYKFSVHGMFSSTTMQYHNNTRRVLLTCNRHCVASCSHLVCIIHYSAAVDTIVKIMSTYIHHQDVALLDPGCPLRINCSCITIALRTGPLIAQHSDGWHSYNSAHQNQGGALLYRSRVGVGINDNCRGSEN